MSKERQYEDECGLDHGGHNSSGEPCGRPAGWGTDFDSGKCRHHRGTSPDGSSHEQNQNATTHSLHARKVNAVYQQVFSSEIQALVDSIYEDYLEDYRERHGEPRTGDKAELFRIASYGKHVHSEEWAISKPSEAKSGNAMVDEEHETKFVEGAGIVNETSYKQTVVQKGQQSLSQDRRMWLKDLGLLENNPDSQKADAVGDLATILSQE